VTDSSLLLERRRKRELRGEWWCCVEEDGLGGWKKVLNSRRTFVLARAAVASSGSPGIGNGRLDPKAFLSTSPSYTLL
jgi:hypothetical protein